jgi:hypothetical protein
VRAIFPQQHEQVLLLHNKYQVSSIGGAGGSLCAWDSQAAIPL